jgi:hypothetical protein
MAAMRAPPPLPTNQQTDWWGRNWKWFVALTASVALVAIGGFVAAIFGFIRSSDAYTGALARARSSPAVVDAIGAPITDGFLVTGNISTTGDSGAAELEIPVKGPRGAGSIFVTASKRLGVWHFDHMIVRVDATRRNIDLSEIRTGARQPTP